MDLTMQWKQALKSKGFHVEHALTVDSALAHCAQTQFDAVICDIFLHDELGQQAPRAGYTLLSYLRNPALNSGHTWGTTVPILVVTGTPLVLGFDVLAFTKKLGADAFMHKPFKASELVDQVLALLPT